ncbi:MAG: peptide chain release factor 1 [Chitinivibrionales bacterium]|nr:peptide chain release factor 1 [Chitinivibrionales bacterium]
MIRDKIQSVIERYNELERQMGSPEVASDPAQMEKLGREHNNLGKGLPVLEEYLQTASRLDQAREMVSSESDEELRELAREEVEQYEATLPALEERIKEFLVPKDPRDLKNAVVEIRAGTGGVEAGIFAADLYRMYTRYAELQGWQTEVLSASYGELNSIKEIVFMVKGDNAYGLLKHESGVHRVQRVPQTETQGRVHTSAASVAVFPEADDVEVEIDQKELRIDVYRASGAGGQHVNKTESAVRIVHIPTGITVTCQDEKSQHKNRAKAMKVLQARLFDRMLLEQEAKERSARRSMVGTGDRSAKIRTYNFPQDRVTDHRINLSLYKLNEIVNGNMQELIDALSAAEIDERIKLEGAA